MKNRISNHIRSNVIGYIALFCFAIGGTSYAATGGNFVLGQKNSASTPTSLTAPVAGKALQLTNRSTGAGATALGLSVAKGHAPFTVNSPTKVANLNADRLDGIDSTGLWKANGNAGTTASSFLGTTDDMPLNLRANNARALRLEPASNGTVQSPNVIGGIAGSSVTPGAWGATISGGGRSDPTNPGTVNRVTDDLGTVGGGGDNTAGDSTGTTSDQVAATVAGGVGNSAFSYASSVGGGADNQAQGVGDAIAGGGASSTDGPNAFIGGGFSNHANGTNSMIPGGANNHADGDLSFAAGNRANANHQGAFVWADSSPFDFASTAQDQFDVRSTGGAQLVSGIDASGNPTSGLELPAGTSGWSTLVNGQPFDIRVNGARGLRIDPASDGTNQSPNVIGGSADNSVAPGAYAATIGGGGRSTPSNAASANRVGDSQGTIAGGVQNQAGVDDGDVGNQTAATVGGGEANTATAAFSTVGGGLGNSASGPGATTSGGNQNRASGSGATVIGGFSNRAQGDFSLAAGSGARAIHNGAFVWADSNNFNFTSTAANEFSVRATGGARFVSGIDGSGNPNAGVQLASGAGSWSSLSDRNSKRAIEPISGRKVLRKLASVPVSTWSYRAQDRSIRHIGPMAQDFYRAFGVGEDRRHIDSVDADGVALAAVKGLNRRLNQKVMRLERQLAALRERVRSR